MAITVERGGSVKGWFPSNKAQRQLQEAVRELVFANLFRGPKSGIARSGDVRIDVQSRWSDGPGWNIQAQVGKTSIAGILIADTLGAARGAIAQRAVVTAAQEALVASGDDAMWRILTGTSE